MTSITPLKSKLTSKRVQAFTALKIPYSHIIIVVVAASNQLVAIYKHAVHNATMTDKFLGYRFYIIIVVVIQICACVDL